MADNREVLGSIPAPAKFYLTIGADRSKSINVRELKATSVSWEANFNVKAMARIEK